MIHVMIHIQDLLNWSNKGMGQIKNKKVRTCQKKEVTFFYQQNCYCRISFLGRWSGFWEKKYKQTFSLTKGFLKYFQSHCLPELPESVLAAKSMVYISLFPISNDNDLICVRGYWHYVDNKINHLIYSKILLNHIFYIN